MEYWNDGIVEDRLVGLLELGTSGRGKVWCSREDRLKQIGLLYDFELQF